MPDVNPSWQAHPIWSDADPAQRDQWVWLRRGFDLNESQPLTLRVSAVTRAQVYVNGHLLGEGPPAASPDRPYFDSYELNECLRSGENCIAVVARYAGGPRISGTAGVGVELRDASGDLMLESDEQWRAIPDPCRPTERFSFGMNAYDANQEWFDARQFPEGWMLPGFDDNDWPQAVVQAEKVTPIPRDIPPIEKSTTYPQAVTKVEEATWLANRYRTNDLSIVLSAAGVELEHAVVHDADALCGEDGVTELRCSTKHLDDWRFGRVMDPCVLLDMGEVVTGQIELDVEVTGLPADPTPIPGVAGKPGASLDIGLAERLIDGQFNNAIEGMFAFRYTLAEGRQTWRSFQWRGFRYLKLRLNQASVPVKIHALRVIRNRYPFEERGQFSCSEPKIDRLWEISRSTIRLCSVDSLMDTPWREQAQWLGDVAAVTLGGIYACFGDTQMPAKFLRQSAECVDDDGMILCMTQAKGSSTIPDYALWWIFALHDHWQYTGNIDIARDCLPTVTSVLDRLSEFTDDDGLVIDPPGWVFIDWADVQSKGPMTAFNAIVAYALRFAVELADGLGESALSKQWNDWHASIRSVFHDRFFDADAGMYRDSDKQLGLVDHWSEQTNAIAVLAGLTPDGGQTVMQNAFDQATRPMCRAEPFFALMVMRAMLQADRPDLVRRLLDERWVPCLVDPGHTSVTEEWSQDGSWRNGELSGFIRTHSHAWSAGCAEFLIRDLIGLQIDEPGCARVSVQPVDLSLDYDAEFPTPRGSIHVSHRGGTASVQVSDGIEVARNSGADKESKR